jgi:hypothetical protein
LFTGSTRFESRLQIKFIMTCVLAGFPCVLRRALW